MFDIPIQMNSKPGLDLNSLSSSVPSANQPAQQPQNNYNNQAQNSYNQPQSNYNNQAQNSYNQPQSNYNNQTQNSYNQPQSNYNNQTQNSYNQPQSNYNNQAQNSYNQPQSNYNNQTQQSGGGVILKKGQKTSLSKIAPNLKNIRIGLGWDAGANTNYDLDSEVFLLGANEKVLGDNWFVFYGQLASPDGAVIHHGDSSDGAGCGDDEIIDINLSQLNPQVAKLVFVVTINEAKENGYNFGQIKNAYIRVIDNSTGKELVKFSLSEYYKEVVSMVVGEIYLKGGEWRFNPVGMGTGDDLEGLCVRYGVNVAG